MKISITVPEDNCVFLHVRDLYERSHLKGESLKDYLVDFILEAAFNDDKTVDEAINYLQENYKSIIEKHPETALLLMDYVEEE